MSIQFKNALLLVSTALQQLLWEYLGKCPKLSAPQRRFPIDTSPIDRHMSSRELIQRLLNSLKLTADHIALAEKLGIPVGTLIGAITAPHFLNVQYQFGAVADILELELWKYQAIALRDDCADGKITVGEYIQWMEDSFPNRKPKT